MPVASSEFNKSLGEACVYRGALEAFIADDAESFFFVDSGSVDIFIVDASDATAITRKPYLTTVEAGGMFFGHSRTITADRQSEITILVCPYMETTIIRGRRSSLTEPENFGLDILVLIERWLACLSEFLSLEGVNGDARLLEADPDVVYPSGCALSAHHGEILWVSADRPMRVRGSEVLVLEPGQALPLSEWFWLDCDTETRVTATHTPGIANSEQFWPAVDRLNKIVSVCAIETWDRMVVSQAGRHDRANLMRRGATSRLVHGLTDVLKSTQPNVGPPEAGHHGRSLQAAMKLVADSVGASNDIRIPGDGNEDSRDDVVAIARRSGLHARKITLAPRWWRRGGPSLLGFAADDGRPLALLSSGRGGYRAVDGATGAGLAVNRKAAARLSSHGLMLYAPVPRGVDSGLGALRHVLHGHARDFRTLLAMGVLGALTALLTPVLLGQLLAEIIPRVDVPMWSAALGALVLGALGTAVFEVVSSLTVLRIEGRIDERLQAAIWARLLSLPAAFFRDFTAGDLADRANGISIIRQLLTGPTAAAVTGGVFSIFSFALLFYYSWSLALYAAALLLVLSAVTWIMAKGQMKHHRAAFTVQGTIDGFLFQMLGGLSKLRIANAESHALNFWANRYAEQKRETLAARNWAAAQLAFNSMFVPVSSLTLFAVIWYGLIEGERQPDFNLADFLSFNAAFGAFAAAMTGLTSAWTTVVTAIPLFERVQPILAGRPESSPGSTELKDLHGAIEFSDVSFRYLPDIPNAVDSVSFHVKPMEYVAFVGPSGSGKSTLYRLLLGFEKPDTGAVLIDGHDLASLDLSAVRRHMGVVLQSGQLSTDSIFKNIIGTAELTLDDAWEAARAAGLAEDIKAFPMGMHTVLSEGGGGISGGQKQRLMIARALASRPRILLLDEATSALDNRTQDIVQNSVKALNVTRILIAHRLSTVRNVDRIYVMDKGRIVEVGTYDALLQHDGLFASLARRQVV